MFLLIKVSPMSDSLEDLFEVPLMGQEKQELVRQTTAKRGFQTKRPACVKASRKAKEAEGSKRCAGEKMTEELIQEMKAWSAFLSD